MRRLLAVVMAVALAGCSFLFVDGPSASTPPGIYPSCDDSTAMPYVDAAIAALYIALIVAAVGDEGGDTDATAEVLPGAVGGGVLFGASAYVGFQRTGRCKDHRNAYRSQFGDPRLQPPPMMYGYPSQEGQACHPQLGCVPGLVCASGLCVRPPSAPIPPSPAPIGPQPPIPGPPATGSGAPR